MYPAKLKYVAAYFAIGGKSSYLPIQFFSGTIFT